MVIIENKIQCKLCGEILISKTIHDFQVCRCLSVGADGGNFYLRRMGEKENIIELSTYTEDEETKL